MSTDWSDKIRIANLTDEPALSEELTEINDRFAAPGEQSPPHVVLNLAGVTYLNSSNIAQLLRLRARIAETGRLLVLCSIGDSVWSLLLLTGLDKVFRFATDPATAIASIELEDAQSSDGS